MLIHASVYNKGRFLYLATFLIPLQGLSFNAGITLSWYKVLFLIAFLGYLLKSERINRKSFPGISLIILYFAYVVVLTLAQWVLDSYTGVSKIGEILGWGSAQSAYRYPVQLLTFICIWGLMIVGVLYKITNIELSKVVNGYIDGNIFSILVGIYQMFASYFGLPAIKGLNFTGFLTDDLLNRATISVSGFTSNIPRLYGLGGEPKHTASFAGIAVALVLSHIFVSDFRYIRYIKIKIVILLLGMILTASSGAWIGLLVILGYFGIVGLFKFSGRMSLALIFLYVMFVLFSNSISNDVFSSIYKQRISDRLIDLNSLIIYEPKDAAFILYAQDHAQNLIFGHGTGGIDFELVRYTPENFLLQGATLTPAYLITRLLGDIGICGMGLFALAWTSWFVFLRKKQDVAALHFLVAGGLALLVTTQVSLAGYLIVSSAMISRSFYIAGSPMVKRYERLMAVSLYSR